MDEISSTLDTSMFNGMAVSSSPVALSAVITASSTTPSTVIDAVPVSVAVPSETVYSKVSVPFQFSSGLNVTVPFSFSVTVPKPTSTLSPAAMS